MIVLTKQSGSQVFIHESQCKSLEFYKLDKQVILTTIDEQVSKISDVTCIEVTSTYKSLAEEANHSSSFGNESLNKIASKLEDYDLAQKLKSNSKITAGSCKRFQKVCAANGIETVEQLIAIGKSNFERLHLMGELCADKVSQALTELYNIDTW